MADRTRRRFSRPSGWFVALVALGVAACSAPGPDPEPGPDPAGTVEVSYEGAVGWLATLDPAEAGQQVQDWARLGLAAALGMDADQLLDEFYDGAVLRDSAVVGLADLPVEPGRALFDGTTLHLLVPADDPSPERTIGLLLDQRRADAGSDPAQVQVHTYRIDGPARRIVLSGRPAEPTAQARAGNGWLERRVDDPASLADFLSRNDQLTRLETRGSGIWAEGWDWPDQAAMITPADVDVLLRGYQRTSASRPGFSLDPGPPPTAEDLRALLPDVSPALVGALSSGDYAGSGFDSAEQLRTAVSEALFDGLPPAPGLTADRTQLWGIYQQLSGEVPYGQARYEGGLAGTEVGMSLFYTDLVAKDWTAGVGSGVPAGRVPGFVPDDRARTPPSLCPDPDVTGESGRLWFGQNDAAFAYGTDGVSIGRQATRLFFRADGGNGVEVEPGYQFGRGLRWWDRNYRAVADYEPQYQRLEQLMRWSGALEWLSLSDRSFRLAGAPTTPSLTFESWYAGRQDLRERAPLRLVRPPSATEESVLTIPSGAYTDCGIRQISGGVSLADASVRLGELPERTPLPGNLSRAVPLDPAATRVDAAGNGLIVRADTGITYELRRGPGTAEVDTTGPPSVATRIGDHRLVADQGRSLSMQFRSDGRTIDAYQQLGELSAGRTTVELTDSGVTVTVLDAFVARFASFLDRFRTDPPRGPSTTPGFRYEYGDGSGTVVALDGTWVRTGPPSPGTFAETLAAEARGPGGEPLRAATGAPRSLNAQDTAALETVGDPVMITRGELLDSVPAGTPVYTDAPSLVPGAIPLTTPIVMREARPRGENGGGGIPGTPRGDGPETGATDGNGPVGGGPWQLLGFGTGTGPPDGTYPLVVLVSDCSTEEPPVRPQECPQ